MCVSVCLSLAVFIALTACNVCLCVCIAFTMFSALSTCIVVHRNEKTTSDEGAVTLTDTSLTHT